MRRETYVIYRVLQIMAFGRGLPVQVVVSQTRPVHWSTIPPLLQKYTTFKNRPTNYSTGTIPTGTGTPSLDWPFSLLPYI